VNNKNRIMEKNIEIIKQGLKSPYLEHKQSWMEIALFVLAGRDSFLLEIPSIKVYPEGFLLLTEITKFLDTINAPFIEDYFGRRLYYQGGRRPVAKTDEQLSKVLDYPNFPDYGNVKRDRLRIDYITNNINVISYITNIKENSTQQDFEDEMRRRTKYTILIKNALEALSMDNYIEIRETIIYGVPTVIKAVKERTMKREYVEVIEMALQNLGFSTHFMEHIEKMTPEEYSKDAPFWSAILAFHLVPDLPDEKTCEIVSLDLLDVMEGIKPPVSYEQMDLAYTYSTLHWDRALGIVDRKPKAENTLLWTMLNSFVQEYKAYPQLPQPDLSEIEEWVIEYL
jgi:hypothetical protein